MLLHLAVAVDDEYGWKHSSQRDVTLQTHGFQVVNNLRFVYSMLVNMHERRKDLMLGPDIRTLPELTLGIRPNIRSLPVLTLGLGLNIRSLRRSFTFTNPQTPLIVNVSRVVTWLVVP